MLIGGWHQEGFLEAGGCHRGFQRMGTQLSAEEEALVIVDFGGLNLGYDATGASTGLRTGKVDRLASLYGTKASNLSISILG